MAIVFPFQLMKKKATAGGGSLLLDLLSASASAAYSTRKLRSAYNGYSMRVRRSSDNTEQDIGFDASGNLDTSALTTFVGAGNGYVKTWYDQSGNGRDATQTTTGSQPAIVASGTVYLPGPNSRAGLRFSGSDLPSYKFGAPSTNFSVSVVGSYDAGSTADVLGTDGGNSTDGIYLQPYSSGTEFAVFNRSGASINVSLASIPAANTLKTFLVTHDSSNNAIAYMDGTGGTQVSAMTWTAGSQTNWRMGAYPANAATYSLAGYISEQISFTSVLGSTDRSTLQTNQKTYFGTP